MDVLTVFHSALIEQLNIENRLGGVVERGVYVPAIFSQSRQKWIEAFFVQNGFIGTKTILSLSLDRKSTRLNSSHT